jgi:GMP synthase (glutamine-hydrolysing)
MKVLLIDCYLDPKGGSVNFLPYLPKTTVVWKIVHEPKPFTGFSFDAVVITGSAACIADGDPWIGGMLVFLDDVIEQGIPCLGVCFGHQVLAHLCGALVTKMKRPEVGWKSIQVLEKSNLFSDIPKRFDCFLSHEDGVIEPNKNLVVLASSVDCDVQAFAHKSLPVFGIQFHPEMPKAESVRLLAYRAEKHPHMNINVGQEERLILSTKRLAKQIFSNFLSLAVTDY